MTHVELWLTCLALVAKVIRLQGAPAAAAAPVASPAVEGFRFRFGERSGNWFEPAAGSEVGHLHDHTSSGDHLYELEAGATLSAGACQG